MACITVPVENKFKERMDRFPWVNWSELAREEILRKQMLLEHMGEFERIVAKSKLTGKDADELSDKIKKSMHDSLKRKGLI